MYNLAYKGGTLCPKLYFVYISIPGGSKKGTTGVGKDKKSADL